MATNTILHFKPDLTGKYIYVPEPDEDDVLAGIRVIQSADFGRNIVILKGDWFDFLPEWLRDVIQAILILGELLVTRFMVDGKWVQIKWHRLGWNFTSLIILFKAAREIVKLFKEKQDDASNDS